MTTLYLFNPSHDEALAANNAHYYPSRIARHLANEWGALPMLWAQANDYIWLTDEAALPSPNNWGRALPHFVRTQHMNAHFWQTIDKISPWGWDPLVRQQLLKVRAPCSLLPSDEQLLSIRQLSSRHSTSALLPLLQQGLAQHHIHTTGQSVIAHSLDEVMCLAQQYEHIMVKSLWSCSGRGVFAINATPSASATGRINRLLREQGGVEVEPHYKGMLDFALEFDAQPNGQVCYAGISLFGTSATGGYAGNWIAPQTVLEAHIAQHFAYLNCLIQVCEQTLTHYLQGRYSGPLGIDMMLVNEQEQCTLHPCIELNLRRTMGYVSLAVGQLPTTEPLPSFAQSLFQPFKS